MVGEGGRERLLVLEDEPRVAATIALVAEAAGFRVRVTDDPNEFLTLCATWRPSHVSVDLHLPHTDGVAVLRQLAATGFRGRVIVASGLDRRVLEAAERSAQEHGLLLVGSLSKPFAPDALRRLLTSPPVGRGAVPQGPPSSSAVDVDAVRTALREGDISTVYQPKVRCRDGAFVGVEALARWYRRDGSVMLPDAFLPVVEAEGVFDEFTEVLFGAAVAFLAASVDDATTLSFNVSARSLHDVAFADRLLALARPVGVSPSRLVLEVTETSAIGDRVNALDALTRARIMGIGVALDDFGTGHSTLVQLARQPFSELKIDKGFVGTALTSGESRTITQAMVQLGHNLGLTVTAEGVEDEATFALLREQGCDHAQGAWLAGAMGAAELVAWANAYDPSRVAAPSRRR